MSSDPSISPEPPTVTAGALPSFDVTQWPKKMKRGNEAAEQRTLRRPRALANTVTYQRILRAGLVRMRRETEGRVVAFDVDC